MVSGPGNLYRIDTSDASCEATSFVPDQAPFGMSFLFDSSTGVDTLQVIQTLPVATVGSGGFAMKFWGGSFWIFINDTVFQVPRNTGVATQVVSDDGYMIVGAGVSDCAPVQ